MMGEWCMHIEVSEISNWDNVEVGNVDFST